MTISKRVRFEVLRRDKFNCMYCGRIAPYVVLHVDHVVPVALGGTDDPSNLVAACADCNSGKASIQPDSPLVQRVSDHAAAYALGMLDKLTHLQADLEQEKVWEAEFLQKWNAWTYTERHRIPIPRSTLNAAWLSVAGAEVVQHAEVQEMSRDRLFINAENAAWRTQLELMRTSIMQRWNSEYPGLQVAGIVFQSSRGKFPRYSDLDPLTPAGSLTHEEKKNVALPPKWRTSVVRWKSMGVPELLFDKAIRIAMEKRDITGAEGEFAYMAGVIWRTIDGLEVDYDLTPEHAATFTQAAHDQAVKLAHQDGWWAGYDAARKEHDQSLENQDLIRILIDGEVDHWALRELRTAQRGT